MDGKKDWKDRWTDRLANRKAVLNAVLVSLAGVLFLTGIYLVHLKRENREIRQRLEREIQLGIAGSKIKGKNRNYGISGGIASGGDESGKDKRSSSDPFAGNRRQSREGDEP